MSKLLLLGGNNAHNHLWIQEVEKILSPFFDETHVHVYEHWVQGSGNMNLDKEMHQILSHIDGDTVIFAKSLGTLLAMKTIAKSGIVPCACIFVGVPLGYVRDQGFPLKKYLSLVSCSVLFVQHSQDPTGSYKHIVEELTGVEGSFTLHDLPGTDHDYKELSDLGKIISDFLF